jgi:hypothetical protein
MKRLTQHLRANVIAYLALFVALGGTSYAALALPAGSVGARQIKNHVIDPVKLNSKFIGASVRYWAIVDGNGHVLASHPRPKTFGFGAGTGVVDWGRPSQSNCFVLATVNDDAPGLVSTSLVALDVDVRTFDANGGVAPHTVDVAILCGPR